MAQTAGGKRKGLVWDLVKDVESVIKKDGNKTSEKRWVCRFSRASSPKFEYAKRDAVVCS